LAKGDEQPVNRKRPRPNAERVQKRVAKFCAHDAPLCKPGVAPLNPGFFQLERMRAENVEQRKARAAKRGKVRGK
jgi:hypothetical protein